MLIKTASEKRNTAALRQKKVGVETVQMDQHQLFWVLSSQSSSYKPDGLYLSIGIALARCKAASRGAKLTEVSLTTAEKGGDLTGALHYIPVISWGSWKTLRLNGRQE